MSKNTPCVYPLASKDIARGQNFWTQWLEASDEINPCSANEMLLILPTGSATITSNNAATTVMGRTISIIPAGPSSIKITSGDGAALIAPSRLDVGNQNCLNANDYKEADPRIIDPDTLEKEQQATWLRKENPNSVQVINIDTISAPHDKPRLKMLRTDRMSINWVEYDGQRDRTQLSPHAHTNFEQGSLSLSGEFIHHLRKPWGANANKWIDDAHLAAGSPAMLTIPVELIHTTEGINTGHHLLIDIFSPAREDFIANGWVSNSDEYAMTKNQA